MHLPTAAGWLDEEERQEHAEAIALLEDRTRNELDPAVQVAPAALRRGITSAIARLEMQT